MSITNESGIALIKRAEGLVLTATPDPTGVLSIGYGHTVGVREGQVISKAQADALLSQDLAIFEAGVAAIAKAPGSNQFSAMVSLAFNIGLAAFKNSTVLREHNSGATQASADAFLMWNKAHVDGALVELAGLTKRRKQERELYLTPDKANPPPPPAEVEVSIPLPIEGVDQTGRSVKIKWVGTAIAALVFAGALSLVVCCGPQVPQHDDGLKNRAGAFDWQAPIPTTFRLVPGRGAQVTAELLGR